MTGVGVLKIKFIVLIIFLFSASSFGGLFEKFPQHSERVLSNGRLITLPVHYYISKGMIVKGDGNFEELNSVLSAQSLKFRWTSRFRRNGETRYKMFYYFVEHVDNSIAPYGEFFVLIPAKSEDGKKKGFLVEQMIVSQRDALSLIHI